MKKYFIILGCIGIGIFLFKNEDTAENRVAYEKDVSPTNFKSVKVETKASDVERNIINRMRDPASTERIPSGVKTIKMNKVKPDIIQYETLSVPGLPHDMVLAKNIFVVAKDEYVGGPNEIVLEKFGLIFFKSTRRPERAAYVAIEEQSGKLYPVSAVIKLENINQDKRLQIISQGLEEHYYHSPTGVMYVQSSHNAILGLSDELRNQNLSPQLEVIKGYHRVR
jgi:hypothetical protein